MKAASIPLPDPPIPAYPATRRSGPTAGHLRNACGFIRVWLLAGLLGASLPAAWGQGADAFAERDLLTGAATSDLGDFGFATRESGEPDLPVETAGRSLWWTWVAPAAGRVQVSLLAFSEDFTTELDTVLAVFSGGSLGALEPIAFNDDAQGLSSECTFTAEPGVAYHFLADLIAGEEQTGMTMISLEFGEPPANDNFTSAIALEGAEAVDASTFQFATSEPGEPRASNSRGATVWWTWTAPADGLAIVSVQGTENNLDTLLTVFSGSTLGDLRKVAFDDDSGPGSASEAAVIATAGTTYYIQADLYGSAANGGAVRITLGLLELPAPELRPANDDFARAAWLSGTAGSAQAENEYATGEPGEPTGNGGVRGNSVWWQWTAGQNGFLRVSTRGSTTGAGAPMDTQLAVYAGAQLNGLDEVAWNDDQGASLFTSEVVVAVEAGRNYHFAVMSAGDSARGTVRLDFEVVPTLPAPSWTARSLEDTSVDSSAFAGSVVLVNLWATWCGPCLAEIPDLISLQEQYAPEGFTVIGVSVDNSEDGAWPIALVNQFVYDLGINYPVVMDRPSGTVERGFGFASAIPTTYLINRDGQIVRKLVGTRTRAQFEQMILPLLTTAPTPPVLRAERLANGQIELSWEPQAGLRLDGRSSLTAPWQPVTGTPATRDGREVVTLSGGAATGFYRLVSP